MIYRVLKRLLDLIVATIVAIISLPLFIPVMIGLKLTGEGYIFYKQKRIGHHNKYFFILKFATMLKNSPKLGAGMITLRNDPRVTPMGGFLRKTKINELPQIFNIILGDITLVGPRPLVDKNFNAYPKEVQDVIYKVKPGLTGIGSIVFRDEETFVSAAKGDPHEYYQNMIAPYKGALEMWYQANCSLWTDLKIIFLTAWAIVFPKSEIIYKVFKDLPERPKF